MEEEKAGLDLLLSGALTGVVRDYEIFAFDVLSSGVCFCQSCPS